MKIDNERKKKSLKIDSNDERWEKKVLNEKREAEIEIKSAFWVFFFQIGVFQRWEIVVFCFFSLIMYSIISFMNSLFSFFDFYIRFAINKFFTIGDSQFFVIFIFIFFLFFISLLISLLNSWNQLVLFLLLYHFSSWKLFMTVSYLCICKYAFLCVVGSLIRGHLKVIITRFDEYNIFIS